MAEIKSTLELVLERAARMGTATSEEMQNDGLERQGNRQAAEFLDSEAKPDTLAGLLKKAPEAERHALRQGMFAVLLRNLFLPRDEAGQKRVDRAMQGIVALHGGSREVAALCKELSQITGRYGEHRKQIQNQLKEQMRMQLQQKLASEALRSGLDPEGEEVRKASARLDPTLDPRYAQEWGRIEAELSSQYTQGLDQYKAELSRLAGL